jgi:hypothetical protein
VRTYPDVLFEIRLAECSPDSLTAISPRPRARSSLSPIVIDFIYQAGNFSYPLGKKILGRKTRQLAPGHRIPSRSGKAAEPVEGSKVGTEDMIGRQHRGEGADLMSYAGWDAFDVEDCFCKLRRERGRDIGTIASPRSSVECLLLGE